MKNLFFILSFLFVFYSNCQEDTIEYINKPWVQVVLNNGKTYIAKVISDDGREILLDTKEIGKLFVKKTDILTLKEIKDEKNIVYGQYRETGSFTTRYFLTPNALPVKKGENYAYIHLLGPEIHIALTDRTSIGVFTSWIASPFGLILKHNIPTQNEKLNFSVGTLLSSSTYLNSFKGFGVMAFTSATYGNRMNNISLSLGYSLFQSGYYKSYKVNFINEFGNKINGYVDYQRPASHSFLSSIAGIVKIAPKTSFFVEFWFTASNVRVPNDFQNISNTEIENQNYYQYYDNNNIFNLFGLETEPHNISAKETKTYMRYTFMFYPGIRILLQNEKAFQITLGSVHHVDYGIRKSFPMPMLSWFKKF